MSDQIELAHAEPALLGESPVWSMAEQCLYYIDGPGREVRRWDPASGDFKRWLLASDPGSVSLLEDGRLLVTRRDGLWTLDPASGVQAQIAPAPFDSSTQRFNDGRPDAQGRLWAGTIHDARAPEGGLFRFEAGAFSQQAGGIANFNGLAWSPDERRVWWSDTKAHETYTQAYDPVAGRILGEREVFARFATRTPEHPTLDEYGGRPDGAAVDVEGYYWVAMFEGGRLLRFAPDGRLDREIKLPVRCPTMPTFGGADLRTLYITTARDKRPAEELAAQPWAGCVLKVRVQTPGLRANIARL